MFLPSPAAEAFPNDIGPPVRGTGAASESDNAHNAVTTDVVFGIVWLAWKM